MKKYSIKKGLSCLTALKYLWFVGIWASVNKLFVEENENVWAIPQVQKSTEII